MSESTSKLNLNTVGAQVGQVTTNLYFSSASTSVQYDNDGRWTWYISEPYLNLYQNYGIAISKFTIDNLVYPINAYNNVLYFDLVTIFGVHTAYSVTVPPNTYTPSQLVSTLETLLEAATAYNWTVSYNSQSQKLSFSNSLLTGHTEWKTGTNTIHQHLGIVAGNTFSAFSTYTSVYPINISGTGALNVITNFPSDVYDSNLQSGVTLMIPVNEGFGYSINYDASIDEVVHTYSGDLQRITLQFTDIWGNRWIPPPSAPFSFVLRVIPNYMNE